MVRMLIPTLVVIILISNPVPSGAVTETDESSVLKNTKLKGGNLFTEYYHRLEIDVTPSAPQYKLPIESDAALKHKESFPSIDDEEALERLARNGFVVTIPRSRDTQFEDVYSRLKRNEVPVFVTSDTILHLYHILFDNLLKEIEEKEFSSDLISITKKMVEIFGEKYTADMTGGGGRRVSKMTSAYRRNAAYFSVAAKLLDEDFKVPDCVEEVVAEELELIDAHAGFSQSPLFLYKEDYSQYVPRGHYTHSLKLKRYFKAMMWYGRMTFLLKGKTAKIRDALVTEDVAMMQTRQAMMIAEALRSDKELHDKWQRMYTVTAFFVGFSDDLTAEDFSNALADVRIAGSPDSDKILHELRKELASYPSPAIHGGSGNIVATRPVTEEDLDKALDKTMGLRLFGQRFIPDSYAMGRLVGMAYLGKSNPLSKLDTPIGPIRGFARGLDVMSVLGSDRASGMLKTLGDADYMNYLKIADELRKEFRTLNDEEWHMNLYWGWLSALKVLLKPLPSGYPTFMTTDAWGHRYLEEALASWSQLRHDTILYAKQSYAMAGAAGPGPKREPKGYVEPAVELYSELRSLNQMMLEGLDDFKLLGDKWLNRLGYVNTLLDRLIGISRKELTGKELTEREVEFIEEFGESLTYAIGDLLPKSTTTAIIADVHTEPNSRQVLEVGTGTLNMIWVACPRSDGSYFICAGPILSYHEFKHPMADRLTDEKWQSMIKKKEVPETDIFRKP